MLGRVISPFSVELCKGDSNDNNIQYVYESFPFFAKIKKSYNYFSLFLLFLLFGCHLKLNTVPCMHLVGIGSCLDLFEKVKLVCIYLV